MQRSAFHVHVWNLTDIHHRIQWHLALASQCQFELLRSLTWWNQVVWSPCPRDLQGGMSHNTYTYCTQSVHTGARLRSCRQCTIYNLRVCTYKQKISTGKICRSRWIAPVFLTAFSWPNLFWTLSTDMEIRLWLSCNLATCPSGRKRQCPWPKTSRWKLKYKHSTTKLGIHVV